MSLQKELWLSYMNYRIKKVTYIDDAINYILVLGGNLFWDPLSLKQFSLQNGMQSWKVNDFCWIVTFENELLISTK